MNLFKKSAFIFLLTTTAFFNLSTQTNFKNEIFNFDSEKLSSKIQNKKDLINNPDNSGYTPLMEACYVGNIEAVELLLKNGANINALSQSEESAVMRALTGYIHLNSRLNRMYIHAKYKSHKQSYGSLVANNKYDLSALGNLFAKNATVSASGGGISGLAANAAASAADFNNPSAGYSISYISKNDLNSLSDKEAILKYKNTNAKERYLAVLKKLLELKPDLNKKNSIGFNVLLLSAISADREIFKLFYESGADVNTKYEDKYDLLYIASINGNFGVVNYLKNNGVKSSLLYPIKFYIGFNDIASVSAMSGDQLSKKELFLKEITADAALYINNSAKSIIFCNIPKYYKITETKDIEILNEPLSDGNITIVERLDDFLNSKNKYEKNLKSGNAPEKVVGNAFCNLITNDNGIWQHESNYSYYYLANKNSISLGYLKFQIFPDHETNYFVNTISTVMPYFLPGIFSLKFDSSSLKQIDNLLNESSK